MCATLCHFISWRTQTPPCRPSIIYSHSLTSKPIQWQFSSRFKSVHLHPAHFIIITKISSIYIFLISLKSSCMSLFSSPPFMQLQLLSSHFKSIIFIQLISSLLQKLHDFSHFIEKFLYVIILFPTIYAMTIFILLQIIFIKPSSLMSMILSMIFIFSHFIEKYIHVISFPALSSNILSSFDHFYYRR